MLFRVFPSHQLATLVAPRGATMLGEERFPDKWYVDRIAVVSFFLYPDGAILQGTWVPLMRSMFRRPLDTTRLAFPIAAAKCTEETMVAINFSADHNVLQIF